MSSTPMTIEMLVGEQVNAVCFVMDYVELHFNGPIVRALNPPTLASGITASTYPDRGSRDALCALIGSRLRMVSVKPGAWIDLSFEDDKTLRIPLDEEASVGPEGAHFVPGDNYPIQVW